MTEKDRARQKQRELEEDARRTGDTCGSSSTVPANDMANLTNGRSTIPPNAKQSQAIAVLTANQHAEDAALDELSDVLGTLKEQSHHMNAQLAQHSKILDGLGDKVDGTADRLQKGSRTMQKIS